MSSQQPLPVLFRMWKKSKDVIALFPTVPSDIAGQLVESYERVGQHAGADLYGIIAESRPATPSEYASLKRELEGAPYHYKLRVYQRVTGEMHDAFLRELRGQRPHEQHGDTKDLLDFIHRRGKWRMYVDAKGYWADLSQDPKRERYVNISTWPREKLLDLARKCGYSPRQGEQRHGDAAAREPVHFLVDWAYIACRKGKQDTSKILSSRSPVDVTCPRCKRAHPEYDWAALERHRSGDVGSSPSRTFEEASAESDRLEHEVSAAGAVMAAFPHNAMGLTPDHVRATPEWRAARSRFDRAFAAQRAFNAVFVRKFKKEIVAQRDARREARRGTR